MLALLALQAAFLCASPTIHDGDNIRCGGRTMRLARIDAPEMPGSPACRRRRADCHAGRARASRDHLRGLVAGRRVTCRVVDAEPRTPGFQAVDRYGRPVVRCSAGPIEGGANGQRAAGVGDLGEAQLRAGHARRW